MAVPSQEDRESSSNSGPESDAPPDSAVAGLSLDKLNLAFADLLGKGEDPDTEEGEGPSDDSCQVTPQSIVEAMLFVGNQDKQSLSSRQIAALMRGVSPREIDEVVRKLNEQYTADRSPYQIVSVGAGYRMTLRDEFSGLRDSFYGRFRQARLSKAAIEVLAIVAYNQPVTRKEVDDYRGKPSPALLVQLVRRQLLRIERPEENPRIAIYWTTDRFLELFHLDSLDDLPQSAEFDKSL